MLCMSQVRSLQTMFLLIRITKENKYSESEEGSADAAMRAMLARRELEFGGLMSKVLETSTEYRQARGTSSKYAASTQ